MASVDVKLTLRRDGDDYSVTISSSPPDSDVEIAVETPGVVPLRLPELLIERDPEALGAALGAALFSSPEILAAFRSAQSVAERATIGEQVGVPLRLRLQVEPSAAELHGLRWETLRVPGDEAALALGERVRFSRFLASSDWRTVQRLPRGELRALVVVAAPSDLARYNLAPLDAAAELSRARAALGDLPVAALAAPGKATLGGIVAALRDGLDGMREFAVLYLVAHGALVAPREGGEPEPYLYLEDEAGHTTVARGAELARQIGELVAIPRLVVLASCQSGGSGEAVDGSPLSALGPRLARAGVPAVVACQGRISLATAAAFTSSLFQQLRVDGEIDRAVAVARSTVRAAADAWMPVLYMRLRSGQLWYEPGFTVEKPLAKWDAVLSRAYEGQCTPILGGQLSEVVYGASSAIAEQWSRKYNFPLSPQQRSELSYVAQYLRVEKDQQYPRDQFVAAVRSQLMRRYKADLPPELLRLVPPLPPLERLLAKVAEIRRARGLPDPYGPIAALPAPIYVTVAADTLLEEALTAAGKAPRSEICRWNEQIAADIPSVFADGSYTPSAEAPLVFHLFGLLNNPKTLVIAEDDYFDFLIGATRNSDLIPPVVKAALVDAVLLFVGFRLDDWSFRVLYRSLMSAQGSSRRRLYTSVAGQVLPDEGRFLAPQAAADYLEDYFTESQITIFWGSVEDFAVELSRRWEEYVARRAAELGM